MQSSVLAPVSACDPAADMRYSGHVVISLTVVCHHMAYLNWNTADQQFPCKLQERTDACKLLD